MGSRQMRRAESRRVAWDLWQVKRDPRTGVITQAPTDDGGVMQRRVRRAIALSATRRRVK